MLHDLEIIDNMPIWLETQTFLQANIARLEELRLKVEDIELWTPFHFLPRKLRKQIKKCEMRKLRQTRSDDVANILRNLPTDLRSSTVKHLCSPAFNNVSFLLSFMFPFMVLCFTSWSSSSNVS